MFRFASLFLLILLALSSALADMPQGVPHDFARTRANEISSVRYRISFRLVPQSPSAPASEEIRFQLHTKDSVILDFRDGTIQTLSVDGVVVTANIVNGHIELPAAQLRLGENVVRAEFTAQIAPAGKALTRYNDRDDRSEYVYTLFVPMDASMAFPCFDQPDLITGMKVPL